MLYLFKDKSKCFNRYAKKRRRNKENETDVRSCKESRYIYVASLNVFSFVPNVKVLLKLICVLFFL